MKFTFLIFVLALMIALPTVSWSWDYFYDGSVLPNDPSLGVNMWDLGGDLSMCITDGSALHIADDSTARGVSFSRSAASAGEPLTVEARIRVTSGNSTLLYIGTPSYTPSLELYSDHLVAHLNYTTMTYTTDLSSFRTIRVATTAQSGYYTSYVWLDGTLVMQGAAKPGGNYEDIIFGSPWGGMGDSYWDYVAYSASFEPVPEPSSLAALAFGLLPFGAAAIRRRR